MLICQLALKEDIKNLNLDCKNQKTRKKSIKQLKRMKSINMRKKK